MNVRIIVFSVTAFTLSCAGLVQAGSSTGNMNVTANVPNNLGVSATDLAFGDLSETVGTEGQCTITVTASGVGAVQIGLNAGLNRDPNGARQMVDGSANTLVYRLYTESNQGTEWGDGGTTHAGAKVTDDLSGQSSANYTVYGVADAYPSGQAVGDYSDTVTVEVTW